MDDAPMPADEIIDGEAGSIEKAVEPEAPPAEPKGRGPGFRLGLVLGLLVGAIVAIVLAPPDEEGPDTLQAVSTTPEASAEGLTGVVAGLRARLREASVEARHAARDAEQAKRTRFEELTRN